MRPPLESFLDRITAQTATVYLCDSCWEEDAAVQIVLDESISEVYNEDEAFTVDEAGCINIGYDGAAILCGRCDGLLGMHSNGIVALDGNAMCEMIVFMNDYRTPEYAPVNEDQQDDDLRLAGASEDEDQQDDDLRLAYAPAEVEDAEMEEE